jgi:tight adherence protein C
MPFIRVLGQRRRRRRLRSIDREVPLLLDALASAAIAGLPPRSALRRAASVVEGPLADELRDALDAVDLGARWRERLDLLCERVPLRDLSRAVAVITRTSVVGASFAEGMTTLAVRARAARRAELSHRARTAPVKMLFPLVFLVLPAFLLLTVVPLLVATLDPIS